MNAEKSKLPSQFYVSITGLQPKGIFGMILFWRYAIPSKIQADKAVGLLVSEVKKINGIQHTLTVWKNKEAMSAYIYSGSHLKAIKVFRRIATGKTFGYTSSQIPTWPEVHQLWLEKGSTY
ncbi:MAG: hypothetical protein NT027_19290 [Proteobacteria bacterium]|nr:hypothetical protein [Pseudomonadota bacterium]